jgi:beta-mannanase
MIFEKDKKYPWLTDSVGKGINDIGDEVECLNSLKNTTFFMVNFHEMNLS